MTRENIHAIMFEAKKMESVVYVDIWPPYREEIVRKPYHANYTPPIFPKYNGIIGNARKHIRRFIDALIAYSHSHKLKLKEVSKSLDG